MKKILSISLLFIFLCQVSYLTVLSGYLQWERAFIIENYCVNKDKPQLLCSGRCYISEVLGEELENSQDENSTAPTVVERPSLTLFCEAFAQCEIPVTTNANTLISEYHYAYFYQPVSSIFQPPKASSLVLFG